MFILAVDQSRQNIGKRPVESETQGAHTTGKRSTYYTVNIVQLSRHIIYDVTGAMASTRARQIR